MWNKNIGVALIKAKFGFLPLAAITLLGLSSCEKDKTSGVPAYVKIESISVETDYTTQGSTSNAITDAWFFANDDDLGVYELPTEIPVLESGNTSLKLFAGIKQSGVSRLRVKYPFFEIYSIDTLLVEEETVTIQPKVKYTSATNFPWLEDFEDISVSLDTLPQSKVDYVLSNNSDSVKEGKACLKAEMRDSLNYFLIKTDKKYSLPKNGDPVYLEFDYKSDVPIQIKVRSFTTDNRAIMYNVVLAKPKLVDGKPVWNKLYAYLSPYVSAQPKSFQYEIYFESGIGNGDDYGFLMLDNIKLVY